MYPGTFQDVSAAAGEPKTLQKARASGKYRFDTSHIMNVIRMIRLLLLLEGNYRNERAREREIEKREEQTAPLFCVCSSAVSSLSEPELPINSA